MPWDQIIGLDYSNYPELEVAKNIITRNHQIREKDNPAIQYMNDEIEYFEEESQIELITLNYEKRLKRRDSKKAEVEDRRNTKLSELGYDAEYDFDEFRDETILNQVYSVMLDMIMQGHQSASSSTSSDLLDNS